MINNVIPREVYYMGFFNNDLVVATKIKENNPAYDILYRQENRAEFLRTVLEDLVRTKTGVDHYLDYTKEEREEKFFWCREGA